MSAPIPFPSDTWFRRLAARMDMEQAAYRELGPIDCAMVVKVDLDDGGTKLYEIVFEGYGVRSIRELARLADATPSHFVIEAPFTAWRDMIDNIRLHGAPDLTHTLNYLTLPDVPMRLDGPDQLEIDAFYRYNETLQRFFNGVARVPTTFMQ
jgi:hypothetical protein